MNLLASLFCGIVFGFGLALSGMTDISKVIGFFDIAGQWDPSLAFVMGGGVLISLPFFQLGLPRLKAPVFADVFRVPTRSEIDLKLLSGAALFGIGWGIVGLCPGPAIASLASLNPDLLWLIIAMFAGMFAADIVEKMVDGTKAEPAK